MEERKSHFERPTSSRPSSLLNWVLIIALAGALAGLGGAWLYQWLFGSQASNYFKLTNSAIPSSVKINFDQPLVNVAVKYQKSVAGVYKPVQSLSVIDQPLFSPEDFLGSAVVVTSDGWLMSTDQVIKNKQAKIVLGDKIYDISDLKNDTFTGLVFVKVDANLLQPVNFQLTDEINIGERLFSNVDLPSSLGHTFHTTFLANDHYITSRYLSSDKIDYYLKISNNSDSQSLNKLAAPYFNLDGDLLGLAYQVGDQTGVLLPAEYIKQAVKNLLNNTNRMSFGVKYIDLENNTGLDKKGNLIYSPTGLAVEYDSVAYKAGLKPGDQIVAINNDAVSDQHTITSLLQNYRVGDKVIIKVIRNNVAKDLEVSL